MNGGKVFVDTNILIYAYDTSAGDKHVKSRKILLDLWDSGLGVLSTQVLQEFFVTVTRKIPIPMGASQARDIVSGLLQWEVVTNDGETVLDAIDLHKSSGHSFWDSLIIAAAWSAGCTTLLSEDLTSGGTIGSIHVENPFKAEP